MNDQTVLIGKLAELSGVTVCTLRVYERRGLIKPLYRRSNGYRYYDASLQHPIRVFGAALSLGLSLSEVGEIFAAITPLEREPDSDQARTTMTPAFTVYERHIAQIDAELRKLIDQRALLERRVAYCKNELAGSGPARIGVPHGVQRRSLPGRVEYVRV
jgi:MerR family transcriptional regulator, copper efflux regulator